MSTALVTSADALARPVVWHLGQLHAFENWLALLLAFGPFVILAVVIVVRRRDDDDDLDGAEEPRQT